MQPQQRVPQGCAWRALLLLQVCMGIGGTSFYGQGLPGCCEMRGALFARHSTDPKVLHALNASWSAAQPPHRHAQAATYNLARPPALTRASANASSNCAPNSPGPGSCIKCWTSSTSWSLRPELPFALDLLISDTECRSSSRSSRVGLRPPTTIVLSAGRLPGRSLLLMLFYSLINGISSPWVAPMGAA